MARFYVDIPDTPEYAEIRANLAVLTKRGRGSRAAQYLGRLVLRGHNAESGVFPAGSNGTVETYEAAAQEISAVFDADDFGGFC